jgi:hypothetical protein
MGNIGNVNISDRTPEGREILTYLFLYGKMTINGAKTNRICVFELN